MRKVEYKKQYVHPTKILENSYLPEIKKMWVKYGYDPDYLLDENDNFYNVLEDFFLSKEQIKAERKIRSYAIKEYCFQRENDVRVYRLLYDLARDSLCGFYNVKEHRYFTPAEVSPYAEWYLDSINRGRKYHLGSYKESEKDSEGYIYYEGKYEELHNKYSAILDNIAALFIAIDVTRFYDEKKLCNKKGPERFKYGPHTGQIFDIETRVYRKPVNFEEFAHDLHTRYWFNDPDKGYHIEAPYKWDKDIPTPENLMR